MSIPRHVAAALAFALLVLPGCGRHLARTDEAVFPDPAPNAITFWGHACTYIDVDGYGIVTDPVFDQATFFRRRKVAAPPPPAYRNACVVLLSHAHQDHLSPRTLATFPADVVILAPVPTAEFLEDFERTVMAMRPHETFEFPGGTITAVVAKHPGGRRGIHPSTDGDALGWVIETPYGTVYWSGDTNYFSGFDDVGARFRPDVALLDINGHLHAMDAVRAAWATRAPTIVPLHWGAYGYLFFSEQKQPRDWEVLREHLGDQLVIVGLGESLPLPGAGGPPD